MEISHDRWEQHKAVDKISWGWCLVLALPGAKQGIITTHLSLLFASNIFMLMSSCTALSSKPCSLIDAVSFTEEENAKSCLHQLKDPDRHPFQHQGRPRPLPRDLSSRDDLSTSMRSWSLRAVTRILEHVGLFRFQCRCRQGDATIYLVMIPNHTFDRHARL